jgi:hypothetical protein
VTVIRRSVEITADEIGDALHAAKSTETFELPVRVLRAGRWRVALVLFEAEDRDEARQQIAFFSALRDPKTVRYDARQLRKSSPENS